MGKLYTRFLPLCWLLAVLFLAQDLYLWGGVAVTPKIGDRIMDQALTQSPIAATYLIVGKGIVDPLGMSAKARDYAAGYFSAVYPDVETDQHTALDLLLAEQNAWLRSAYWGCPILLLLAIVLQFRKPKQIRSFGT